LTVSGEPADIRDYAYPAIWVYFLIYLTAPVLVLRTNLWRNICASDKFLYYLLILLSTPMLFALERGNTIILAPIFLALVISKIGLGRAVGISLLINIKPYFAILLFYYLARRNWRGLLNCSLLSGFVFLTSGLLFDKDFLFLFKNILDFSNNGDIFSLREVMSFPSSVSAFTYVLKNPDGASYALSLMSPTMLTASINIIDTVKSLILLIALMLIMINSKFMKDKEIFALLIILITNLGVSVGGYTFIFYIVLIPVFAKMKRNILYYSLLTLIALPLDIVPLKSELIGQQYSYIGNGFYDIEWTLGMGSFIRPPVNFLLLLLFLYQFSNKNKLKITNIH